MNETNYHFFYNNSNPFSQWYMADFTVERLTFKCAEQYMMYHKALLFADREIAEAVLQTKVPSKHKALGRKVQGFDAQKWQLFREGIVYMGNYYKFTQNPELKKALLATGSALLVEASPTDRIWGVGLAEDDPKIQDAKNWRGLNLLGMALSRVRETVRWEEDGNGKR